MSKYCIKCGTKLADDDLFCGSCGAKQETVEGPIESPVEVPVESKAEKYIDVKIETADTGFVSESATSALKTNNKCSKKPLIFAISSIIAICIVAIFAIFMFDKSKGLVALDEVEQKLNEAYIKVWEGYDIDFNGVTEFEIENVDEDTHDQTFSCVVMQSADAVTGLQVIGWVKDGQVVQMQSIYVGSLDAFNQLDTDAQASLFALVIFPISIFKENIDTIQEFGDVLRNMDVVNDGSSGPDNMRTVDGNIEYTYMGGSGNGIAMSSFNIRYLPAFPTGFFEDDTDFTQNDFFTDDTINNDKTDDALESDYKAKEVKNTLKKAKVGESVFFGIYEQDNNISNGCEDIEWLVLEVKDEKVLLISKYALDCKQYNTSYAAVTWETCSLRKWLNNEFINYAFSVEEKTMISAVTVSAHRNPKYKTNPGKATQDRVFLLSLKEAKKYFKTNSARKCEITDYAVAQGAYLWWLRSPGKDLYSAVFIDPDGYVGWGGLAVEDGYTAVRPALWIDLNSKI